MRKGRFNSPAPDLAQRYGESVSFDRRLYRYDIAGSIAHAAALAKAGIITADDYEKIAAGLHAIEEEIAAGKFQWDPQLAHEHRDGANQTNRFGRR